MSEQERETGASMAGLIDAIARLKHVPRTGWLDRGVPPMEAESVADHAFGVALLAWAAAEEDSSLDRNRVLALALIHDLAESIAGDRTPYERADVAARSDSDERITFLNQRHVLSPERRAEKRAAEADAFARIIADLPETARAELTALWREYDERSTPEARFVKQTDILETYLQSLAYARSRPGLPVASFAAEVAEAVTHPALVAIRDAATRET